MTIFPEPVVPSSYNDEASYWAARKALMADEKKLSFRAGVTSTPTETAASRIVAALKTKEKETLYGKLDDAGSFIEHAHQYLPAKDIIDSTRLLEIARRAPKGALLHCHLDAMLPPLDSLVKAARGRAGLCLSMDMKAGPNWFKEALPNFTMFSASKAAEAAKVSFFDEEYIPGTFFTYERFVAEIPGGLKAAEDFVCARILLQREDVYHQAQTVDGIWRKFNRAFMTMRGLLLYQSAFLEHFRLTLADFAADNISYVRLISFLSPHFVVEAFEAEVSSILC